MKQPRHEQTNRTIRLGLGLVLTLTLIAALPAAADDEDSKGFRVLSVLTSTVTIDAGRMHGLTAGRRLEVLRDGEPVAEVEVTFVAERSSSCQIVEQLETVLPGDQVGFSATDPAPVAEPPATSSAKMGSGDPSKSARRSATKSSRRSSRNHLPNVSGNISFGWQHFADGSERGRDFDQTTARVSVRMKEIAGSPFEMSIRLRGRENRIAEAAGSFSERRDRLYELAMTYEPPEGRVFVQMGRLRSGPLVGFDYLDGILGEVRLKPRFGIGGFYGTRSNIDELGFQSGGQTYGVFFHYRRERSRESSFYADLLFGGVGEYEGGEINREYLSMYARLGSGSRWTLYQRADVDFNRNWRRDLAGDSYQVSNLLLSGTYRVSEALRFGLSYDQRRRFRELESRDTPEERFDTRLRDGLRATIYLGRPRGIRATASFGQRRVEGTSDDSNTITASVYHSDVGGWNLLLAADYSTFAGATSDGQRLGLRIRKYFRGGHDVGLTLGTSETSSALTGDVRQNQWLRLSGNSRLPRSFFVLWEIEANDGDDLTGVRSTLQLGYRL